MDKQTIKEKIMQPILNAGFDVYFVGGCVRDSLLNRKVSDFDIKASEDSIPFRVEFQEAKIFNFQTTNYKNDL